MMSGASDQKTLDFKPRNEHRHYGNIWVTDYQKHNSEKLIKHWHVEMHKEKEQLETSEELIRKYSKMLMKNIYWKKIHTWKHQINMSIWYTSQYPKEFLGN